MVVYSKKKDLLTIWLWLVKYWVCLKALLKAKNEQEDEFTWDGSQKNGFLRNMKKGQTDLKMDKKAFSVVLLTETSGDKDYWFQKTPIERLKHMERLRRINYGHAAAAGLQRFLEIIE